MKLIFCKRSISIFSFWILLITLATAQGNFINFNTIPPNGNVLVYTHQDDDLIWMLPFWNITDKFIGGGMPTSPVFEKAIQEQQTFLDNQGYNIDYESNWITPWPRVTDAEYSWYYWSADPLYNYLANDHLLTNWDNNDALVVRGEINKIKAKLEQYIANPAVMRIVTHNNWGEYGHQQHKAVNVAVRELAVKYRKDVWMLGCDNGSFYDIAVPDGITYTLGNFDGTLFSGIRSIYQANHIWTWVTNYVPSGNHKFIKVVDGGNDKSNILTGEQVTVSGPEQNVSGAYIFDGIDDYMTLDGNNNTSFTIAMRVRPDQTGAMDISKMSEYPSAATCDRSFYMKSDGHLTARMNDGTSRTVTSTTILPSGSWTHIAMTGDGSNLKIYINGQLEGTVPAGTVAGYVSPEFVLGQAQETSSFYKGQISDVKFFDHALSESEIAALSTTLTILGVTANDRIYDGTTVATLNTGTAALVGVSSGDAVSLVSTGATGNFADKNIGTNKPVTTSGFTLSGANAAKYTLVQPVAAANITAKELTVGGTFTASNKNYNGTTAATIATNNLTLPAKASGDIVNLTAVAVFADNTVGTAKTVSLTGSSITGGDAGNYTLSLSGAPTTAANIIAKALYIGGTFTANNKIYDGTTAATIATNSLTLLTKVGSDDVTLTSVAVFANQSAGTGKTVSLTGSSLAGVDNANYTLSMSGAPTALANITPKEITITPTAGQSKIFEAADPVFLYTNSEWSDNLNFTGALGRATGETAGVYAYNLNTLSAGSNYSLVLVAPPVTFEILNPTGIQDNKDNSGLTLKNYPNPFTASTKIIYTLPFDGNVSLSIQNLSGQILRTFINEMETKGDYTLNIEDWDLHAGVFLVTLRLEYNGKELKKTIRLIRGKE